MKYFFLILILTIKLIYSQYESIDIITHNINRFDSTTTHKIFNQKTAFERFENFVYNVKFLEENSTKNTEIIMLEDPNPEKDCALVNGGTNTYSYIKKICGFDTECANDKIKGVEEVPEGKALVLFSDYKCTGYSWKIKNEDKVFDNNDYDTLFSLGSYIFVDLLNYPSRYCAWFYELPCLQGKRKEFCEDIFDLEIFDLSGNIGSIRIGPNSLGFELFSEKYYKGDVKLHYWSAYGMNDDFYLHMKSFRFRTLS